MVKEKRVNVGLKEDVHSQAKIIAILKGIQLGKYLEQCIEKGMEQDRKVLEKIKLKDEK